MNHGSHIPYTPLVTQQSILDPITEHQNLAQRQKFAGTCLMLPSAAATSQTGCAAAAEPSATNAGGQRAVADSAADAASVLTASGRQLLAAQAGWGAAALAAATAAAPANSARRLQAAGCCSDADPWSAEVLQVAAWRGARLHDLQTITLQQSCGTFSQGVRLAQPWQHMCSRGRSLHLRVTSS